MERPQPYRLLVIAALLYMVTIGLQFAIDPDREHFVDLKETKSITDVGKQSFELLAGTLLGFREVAAGLLWVRADEYFHSGKYDDLVPLFYIVTWLDPHQLDVYSTGAWHLAYNLGDQRLIPEGARFLNKGIQDNPNVWDMYFQQSYLHNHKIKDYATAVKYARLASTKPGTDNKPAPYYIDNAIAHNLEANGQIDEMFVQWERNLDKTQNRLISQIQATAPPNIKQKWAALNASPSDRKAFLSFISDTEVNGYIRDNPDLSPIFDAFQVQYRNLTTSNLRKDYFRKGAGQPGYKFDWNAKPHPRWVNVGDNQLHQVNTNFDFKVRQIGNRKLEVSGHIEGADFTNKLKGHRLYTRMFVWFRDKNYKQRYAAHADDFEWQKNNLTTYMKEISFPTETLKKGEESTEFRFILDFSKDPEDMEHDPKKLFPFQADQYELTVTIDPTRQSLLHQDAWGWKGEGLTDDRYLVTDERGIRMISKTVTLDRKDVVK
ncbi:MAG: hypothetical protein KY468_01870 [Armatimonadetes bacterium]|nr:hypothetical protein [Armatimonadota bacterium]